MKINGFGNYTNFTGIKWRIEDSVYVDLEDIPEAYNKNQIKKVLNAANDALNKTKYDVFVQSTEEGFKEDKITIKNRESGELYYELDLEGLPVVSGNDERIAMYPIKDPHSKSKHPRVGVLYEPNDYRNAEYMVHEYYFNKKPLIYRIQAAVDIATKPIRETM